MAELKSLTGDAPYLGYGNQEQAPEFFASQLYSRYPNGNPYPYTRYGQSWANRYPYYDYMQRYGYGGYPGYTGGCQNGCQLAQRSAYNIKSIEAPEPIQSVPVSVPQSGSSPLGLGGVYQGRGNEWVSSKAKKV
uniref:Uncharacterized protein n=1 Tax=Acrobeloides nanus TaxID=290746 RepID=A0A914EBY5_9BILA